VNSPIIRFLLPILNEILTRNARSSSTPLDMAHWRQREKTLKKPSKAVRQLPRWVLRWEPVKAGSNSYSVVPPLAAGSEVPSTGLCGIAGGTMTLLPRHRPR